MGDGRGKRVCAALSALAVLLLVSPAAAQRNIGVAPVPGGGGARFYTDSWAVVIGINATRTRACPSSATP